MQHGKSCKYGGPRPPGAPPHPERRPPAPPPAPRPPRPPPRPKVRPAGNTREACVEGLCYDVKQRLAPAIAALDAAAARDDDGVARLVDARWAALRGRYADTPLACVAHTVRQLGKYYAKHDRRVDLDGLWKLGLTKWEKLLHSLAAGLLKMAVETDNRLEFICDVLLYVLACWREAPARRRRYAEPRRKRVR